MIEAERVGDEEASVEIGRVDSGSLEPPRQFAPRIGDAASSAIRGPAHEAAPSCIASAAASNAA